MHAHRCPHGRCSGFAYMSLERSASCCVKSYQKIYTLSTAAIHSGRPLPIRPSYVRMSFRNPGARKRRLANVEVHQLVNMAEATPASRPPRLLLTFCVQGYDHKIASSDHARGYRPAHSRCTAGYIFAASAISSVCPSI